LSSELNLQAEAAFPRIGCLKLAEFGWLGGWSALLEVAMALKGPKTVVKLVEVV
jgi:hypothetical protein